MHTYCTYTLLEFCNYNNNNNIAALIPAKTPAKQLITDILLCAMVQYSLCHLDLKVMILNTLRKRMILRDFV